MERAVLELLGNHASMALVVCDADGTITMSTRALDRIFGGPLPRNLAEIEQMEQVELRDVTGERRLGLEELPMFLALRGQTITDAVIWFRRSDRRIFYLRCNAGPLRNSTGQVRGAMTLVQDVTAEWTAAAKQAELRDRLVTTVNHEIRTPLTKLIGHVELLAEAATHRTVPASEQRSINAIARATRDLATMAERLSHLAQLDAATRLDPSRTDVADLVRSVADQEADRAHSCGVEIRVVGPSHLPAAIDRRLVSRALHELLDNAVRHAPEDSVVTVDLGRLDGHLEICVADEGPGIPASERERVLEPFEHGLLRDETSSSTGLGLAVVGSVAAAHGGTITLEANDPRGLVARLCVKAEGA